MSTGRGRSPWLAVVVVGFVAAAASTAWAVGARVRSPDDAAAGAREPSPSWITAPVERRRLEATVIARADVGPVVTYAVRVPSSVAASPVVTAVGVRAGDEVAADVRLIEVSGRPIFVVAGDVPAYRDMKPGMRGGDVAQLQRVLIAGGCPAESDGSYGPATELCVAAFYDASGYAWLPTGASDADDLAAARRAVSDADDVADSARLALTLAGDGADDAAVLQATVALDEATRALADANATAADDIARADAEVAAATRHLERLRAAADPPADPADLDAAKVALDVALANVVTQRRAGESSIATARGAVALAEAGLADVRAAPDVSAERLAFEQAVAARDLARSELEQLEARTGPIVPMGEIVFVPSLPARVEWVVGALGPLEPASGSTPADASSDVVARLSSGGLQAVASLDVVDRQLVRVGMDVELLDELTGDTRTGTVQSIADGPRTDATGAQGYDAVVVGEEPLPAGWSGTNVRATFTSAATDGEVLVVPLAAVSSGADGTARVRTLAAGATEPTTVAVSAGLSADGFVAVEPVDAGALRAGDRVVVGR